MNISAATVGLIGLIKSAICAFEFEDHFGMCAG